MNLYGVILTIVVLIGIAIFILLFERKRATGIQRDLRSAAEEQKANRRPPAT